MNGGFHKKVMTPTGVVQYTN